MLIFPDSPLAHELLDGLHGVEIGAAAHNPYNIPGCIFVDYTDSMETVFKKGEEKLCGSKQIVQLVAEGDDLPFRDNTLDYVLSSHVLEHFFNPIGAILEWFRVLKPGGLIFMIVPKARALPDEERPPTTLEELLARHSGELKPEDVNLGGHQTSSVTDLPLNDRGHWSVWDLKDFLPLCEYFKWDVVKSLETDDKVQNGFCVVLRKTSD